MLQSIRTGNSLIHDKTPYTSENEIKYLKNLELIEIMGNLFSEF